MDGLEGQELPPLHPNCGCAIMPMPSAPPPGSIGAGEADGGAWRGVMRNLLDIPSDAWGMLEGFFNAQYERFADGHYLDWLTLGIFSGYWNAGMERTQTMMESTGMYSVLNWMTSGFPDIAKGAAYPEKPLSLEHWMDSIGVASAVYGALEVSKQAAARTKPAKTPVADAKGISSFEGRNETGLSSIGDYKSGTENLYTKDIIIKMLDRKTTQSTKIANGLKTGEIKLNILSDDLFYCSSTSR